MKRFAALFSAALLLLAGCGAPAETPSPAPPETPVSQAPPRPESAASVPSSGRAALPLENAWIASLADEIAAPIAARELPPVEEIRAAYLWLIENVYFADPVGLDSWRYHGDPDTPPPYLENRALSPLRFGVGSCEDFAAAMAVLLRRLGYKAQYVSGLTISIEGDFVDHAWTVVQLDGRWYHLDPQLEQNVAKSGRVSFRYFLRDDRTMLADHRWGESLAAYYGGAVTPEQREIILTELAVPACPETYAPSPAPAEVSLPGRPDPYALRDALDAEREAWLSGHAPPGPVTLDATPPIYAVMPDPPVQSAADSTP